MYNIGRSEQAWRPTGDRVNQHHTRTASLLIRVRSIAGTSLVHTVKKNSHTVKISSAGDEMAHEVFTCSGTWSNSGTEDPSTRPNAIGTTAVM